MTPFRLELTTEQLLESLADAIVFMDGNGRILLVNSQAEKIFGYTKVELHGRPVEILIPERLREAHIAHRSHYFSNPEIRPMGLGLSLYGRRKDGVEVPVEISLSPLRIKEATVVVASIRDLTHHQRMREALQVSEARFQTLVDSMNDIIFTLDTDQRHTGVYGRWLKKYGVSPDFFLGKTAREILGPEEAIPHETAHQFALTGEYVVYEWSTEVNSVRRHIQTSLSPIRNAQGNITGMVGVGRDITDRKWMEEMLQKSREDLEKRVQDRAAELLRTSKKLKQEAAERERIQKALEIEFEKGQQYLNVIGTLVVVLDRGGIVLVINRTGCEILGCGEKEIVGRNWFESFLPERIRSEVTEVFTKLMAGEIQPVEYHQNPVQTRDGEERMISWHNTILRDEEGKIYATLSSGLDITDRLRLEQQIRQSEKLAAVGQMTSGLAHEIGTPLNVIAGRAELMLRKMNPSDPLRDNLERILKQIERITKIVNQLLDFTRAKPLEVRAFAMAPMLDGLFSLFEHQIDNQNITAVLNIEDSLPEIHADPDQIQQVFLNIIHNAIQAMEGGGTLTVRIGKTLPRKDRGDVLGDRYLKVQVIDTGVGISPESLPQIFDPFFSTKKVGEGTGLGLSVCYSIVKNHGGMIDVKSRVGKGSTFTVYLPLAASHRPEIILSKGGAHG